MAYIVDIPKKDLLGLKNKCYVQGFSNVLEDNKYVWGEGYDIYISKPIEFKRDDILLTSTPSGIESFLKDKYNTDSQLPLRVVLLKKDTFDGNSIIQKDENLGVLSLAQASSKKYIYSNYETFKSYEVNTVLRNDLYKPYNVGYRYIMFYTFVPDDDKLNIVSPQYSSYILRQGDDPKQTDKDWLKTQNSLSFKHFLYQKHKKKGKM